MDIVGHRDRPREPSLLRPHLGQLGFESRDISFAVGHLCRDRLADLIDYQRQQRVAKHVQLELMHERFLDLETVLVDGRWAHGAAAVAVTPASIREHALRTTTERAHAMRNDRTAAHATLRETGERVLRGGSACLDALGPARGEPLLNREPDVIGHDAPLRDVGRDHVGCIGLHAYDAAGLPHFLDPSVDVDATIARIEQDRPHRTRRPRAAAAATGGRCRNAFIVQPMRDLLDAASIEVFGIDASNDRRLLFLDGGDRELAVGPVVLAFEAIAEARAARDPPVSGT